MRLALIGDIHLYRLWAAPWTLLGKRLAGQCNLWLNRRHRFDRRLLAPVFERVMSIEPDMLLFSGDLTTTAQQSEFDDTLRAIEPLSTRIPTVIVPGNHDVYTFTSAWVKRMRKTLGELVAKPAHFQSLTGRWHLLALDSAVPRTLNSRGLIGEAQLSQAGKHLAGLESEDGLIVLCHYPPRKKPDRGEQKWQHRLADADALEDLLRACPARTLLLHGHLHEPWHWPRTEPGLEHVTDICAGAPCQYTAEYPAGQGFWQIDLPADSSQPAQLARHTPRHGNSSDAGHLIWDTIDVS